MSTTVRMNEDRRGVEIRFSEPPSQKIKDKLRLFGFIWHPRGKYWYAKQTVDRIAFAESMKEGKDIEER